MYEKFFRFIEKTKDNNNPIILFIRLIYSLTSDWQLNVINLLAGAYIPHLFTCEKDWFICVFLGLVLIVNFYYYLVKKYRIREYGNRKLSDEVMKSCMLITNTLAEYQIENISAKGFFQYSAQFVCQELYTCLKQYFNCEFRISVVQQFVRNEGKTYYKMVARKSEKRSKASQLTQKNGQLPYYYEKLFNENTQYCICLQNKEEIDKARFVYNSRTKSKIQQYIALLEDAGSDKVAFVLQIDVMEKNKMGKDRITMERNANRFLLPFLSILTNAYQHERALQILEDKQ